MVETYLADAIIKQTITGLYEDAGVSLPNQKRAIAPLGELIGSMNLVWQEVANLTSHTASEILLRQGGIINPLPSATEERLAGFMYANIRCGAIFVEQNDRLTRRRFSAAHELGHYLLHFLPLVRYAQKVKSEEMPELVDGLPGSADEEEPEVGSMKKSLTLESRPEETGKLPPYEQMEEEANLFAAELLMPEVTVAQLAESYASRFQGRYLVKRLASDMLVSQTAMNWRLRNLGYIAPGNARLN